MGATERRERQRAEVRTEIIEAAKEIVMREGYHALTMRRVADAVDYSPAAIYQYFENRDAIAIAVSSGGFEQLVAALEPARAIADPRARLETLARTYIDFGLTNPQAYRLMFMDDPEITNAVLEQPNPNDCGTQAYLMLLEPLIQLARSGKINATSEAEVRAVTDAFWVMLHGIASLKLTCPRFPETQTDTLVDTTLAVFFDGVLKR